MAKKEISYSEAMAEIDSILAGIEQDELDVDELSEKVKRVSFLIKLCRDKLHNTRQEVEKIFEDMNQDENDE